MAVNRPDLYVGVAFNADPFDASATPVWTDLSSRVYRINSAKRGRQYELDRNQTGEMGIDWHNADEALNPVNTGSPYSPNVLPYRQILARVMWPNGGTGNLLNLAYNATDASFESYVNGAAAPSWLTRVGGVSPTITTTTPQQGTQCCTYAVTSGATVQGLSWTVPCIPGRQYTASAYVRQSSASTQQLNVGGFYAFDTFATAASNGWSPLDSGQTVSTSGGSASDYSVSGGAGRQSHSSVNVLRACTAILGAADFDITVDVSLPVGNAAGAAITQWICGRLLDGNNYYIARLDLSTGGNVSLALYKRTAGTLSGALAGPVTVGTGHASGDTWRVHFTGTGTALAASAWLPTIATEPTTPTVSVTDTSLTAGTQFGLMSRLESGNTNTLPVVVSWSNLKIKYSLAGTSTTTTGTYVRLASTFTAQQPTHTVQLATVGTAVAGTVLVDALQDEPGAAAGAFTTSGPLIRNIWTRGYVERWPIGWVDAGFRGISSTPCIGPFGILANADLHTEIRNSIMGKAPTYYWPLQEPSGAVTFAEASGNNGPPLVKASSPIGVGPTFAPGTAMNVAGDNSGTGVRTACFPGDEGVTNRAFSCLQLGYTGGPQLIGPSTASGSATTWSASCAFIMTRPANVPASAFSKFVYFSDPASGSAAIGVEGQNGNLYARYAATAATVDQWGDGKPHLYVTTTTISGGTVATSLWIDGTLVFSGSIGTSSLSYPRLCVNVGGAVTYTYNQASQDQTISHLAYWNRALSSTEAADLYNAFKGYVGEASGTRIARYLSVEGFTGPTNIQTGASTLVAASVNEGDGLLDTCQYVSDSEFGNLYEGAEGVAFASRFDRYQKTTSAYTFGESVSTGEYPYEDDVTYDFDPTLILNIADITQTGGVKTHAEDGTGVSQKRYGKKNFSRTVDLASANETVDAATWVVANRKDPRLRVAAVTFNPAAVRGLTADDGTLWPMVLTLEIGTRVTVKRRPKAANAGAGITMSADYFVENIEHHGIDLRTNAWQTTLLLSPVNVAQPWILQDAVFGVLDSTTVLGF